MAVLLLALAAAGWAAIPRSAHAPGNPALLAVLAVTLAAWYGGFGPGVLVTALAAALSASPEPSASRVGRLLLFVTQGTLISLLMESLHASRRRTEKSESQMRTLFEGTADAILLVDDRGAIRAANPAAERVFGYPAAVLIGNSIESVLPGTSPEGARTGTALQLLTAPAPDRPALGLRRDGSTFPVEVTAGTLLLEGHQYTSVVARDITKRKKAEEAARESAELLRVVTDTARVGLVLVDESHRYLHANRASIRMLGLPGPNLVGLGMADLLSTVYDERMRSHLDRALRGERVTDEMSLPPAAEPGEAPRFYRVDYEPHVAATGVRQVVVVLVEITQLRMAETAFKENEGRLGLFIEHAPAAIAMFDRDMRYIAVSRRWLTDYRLGDRTLVGLCHYDVFPDLPEPWKEVHRRALAGEVIRSNEDYYKRTDVSEFWIRWEVRPWLNTSGEIGGVVIATQDITERKRAEVANARLAAIVDSSEDAIVGKDLNGVITSWNAAAERLFGYSAAEAVGRNVTLLIPPERLEEESEILARVRAGKPVEHYETVRKRKDGRRVDVSLTVSPVRDADGRIIGASKIARDISERKRALDEIRQHAMLLDQAFDPILAWELDGPIKFWNEGATRLYGFDAGEAIGHASHELLQTVFPAGFDEFNASLRGRGCWEGELRHRTKNLDWVAVDSRMTVVPRPDRRVWVLESNRDVTDRKRAEERLRRSTERLEALSRQLLRAQEDERRRIAQGAHDEIGQGLTAAEDQPPPGRLRRGRLGPPDGVRRDRRPHAGPGPGDGARPPPFHARRPRFGRRPEVVRRSVREPHRAVRPVPRRTGGPPDRPRDRDGVLPHRPGSPDQHRPARPGDAVQRRVAEPPRGASTRRPGQRSRVRPGGGAAERVAREERRGARDDRAGRTGRRASFVRADP
ncbi:MAG: PAS domain S-box protein [Isosphaeraceae bacterium]